MAYSTLANWDGSQASSQPPPLSFFQSPPSHSHVNSSTSARKMSAPSAVVRTKAVDISKTSDIHKHLRSPPRRSIPDSTSSERAVAAMLSLDGDADSDSQGTQNIRDEEATDTKKGHRGLLVPTAEGTRPPTPPASQSPDALSDIIEVPPGRLDFRTQLLKQPVPSDPLAISPIQSYRAQRDAEAVPGDICDVPAKPPTPPASSSTEALFLRDSDDPEDEDAPLLHSARAGSLRLPVADADVEMIDLTGESPDERQYDRCSESGSSRSRRRAVSKSALVATLDALRAANSAAPSPGGLVRHDVGPSNAHGGELGPSRSRTSQFSGFANLASRGSSTSSHGIKRTSLSGSPELPSRLSTPIPKHRAPFWILIPPFPDGLTRKHYKPLSSFPFDDIAGGSGRKAKGRAARRIQKVQELEKYRGSGYVSGESEEGGWGVPPLSMGPNGSRMAERNAKRTLGVSQVIEMDLVGVSPTPVASVSTMASKTAMTGASKRGRQPKDGSSSASTSQPRKRPKLMSPAPSVAGPSTVPKDSYRLPSLLATPPPPDIDLPSNSFDVLASLQLAEVEFDEDLPLLKPVSLCAALRHILPEKGVEWWRARGEEERETLRMWQETFREEMEREKEKMMGTWDSGHIHAEGGLDDWGKVDAQEVNELRVRTEGSTRAREKRKATSEQKPDQVKRRVIGSKDAQNTKSEKSMPSVVSTSSAGSQAAQMRIEQPPFEVPGQTQGPRPRPKPRPLFRRSAANHPSSLQSVLPFPPPVPSQSHPSPPSVPPQSPLFIPYSHTHPLAYLPTNGGHPLAIANGTSVEPQSQSDAQRLMCAPLPPFVHPDLLIHSNALAEPHLVVSLQTQAPGVSVQAGDPLHYPDSPSVGLPSTPAMQPRSSSRPLYSENDPFLSAPLEDGLQPDMDNDIAPAAGLAVDTEVVTHVEQTEFELPSNAMNGEGGMPVDGCSDGTIDPILLGVRPQVLGPAMEQDSAELEIQEEDGRSEPTVSPTSPATARPPVPPKGRPVIWYDKKERAEAARARAMEERRKGKLKAEEHAMGVEASTEVSAWQQVYGPAPSPSSSRPRPAPSASRRRPKSQLEPESDSSSTSSSSDSADESDIERPTSRKLQKRPRRPSKPKAASVPEPPRAKPSVTLELVSSRSKNIFTDPVEVTGKRERKPTERSLAAHAMFSAMASGSASRSPEPVSAPVVSRLSDGDNSEDEPLESKRKPPKIEGKQKASSKAEGKRKASSKAKGKGKANEDSSTETFCHQCRRSTTLEKMRCRIIKDDGEVCTKLFCINCIVKRYPEITFDPYAVAFHCPYCLNTCNCTVCSRKRGEEYVPPPRGRVDPVTLKIVPAGKMARKPNFERRRRLDSLTQGSATPSPRRSPSRSPSRPDVAASPPPPLPENRAEQVSSGAYWGRVYDTFGNPMGGAFIGEDARAVVVRPREMPEPVVVTQGPRVALGSSTTTSDEEPPMGSSYPVEAPTGTPSSPELQYPTSSDEEAVEAPAGTPSSPAPQTPPRTMPRKRVFVGEFQPAWGVCSKTKALDTDFVAAPPGVRAYVGDPRVLDASDDDDEPTAPRNPYRDWLDGSLTPLSDAESDGNIEFAIATALHAASVADADPVAEPVAAPVTEATAEPAAVIVAEFAAVPVAVSIAQPVVEPVAEPISKPVAEPVAEPAAEPAAMSVAEPIVEPAAEPIAEPISKPVTEPVAEPAVMPIVVPVVVPVVVPISKPNVELVAEPTSELSAVSIVEPSRWPIENVNP